MNDETFTTVVKSADTYTKAKVVVRFDSDQVVGTNYSSYTMVPFQAELTYEYRAEKFDGWTEHLWVCTFAQVTGGRVLKPGPGGEQRVSEKVQHSVRYYPKYSQRDVAHTLGIPAFLADLIETVRPSGEVDALSV